MGAGNSPDTTDIFIQTLAATGTVAMQGTQTTVTNDTYTGVVTLK